MFQILTFRPLSGQKGFSSTWKFSQTEKIISSLDLVPVPCPIILNFALVSRMLKKKSFGIRERAKTVAVVGIKEREQEGRWYQPDCFLLWTSVLPVSVFSPPSVSLCWSQYETSPRAPLLQPMWGPGGSSLCLLHLIPTKFRSQLGIASPTDSLLALGQIHNFNANSYSAKTPNWLPEDLTAKYVSAITHSSCKTSMTLEKILGALLDLEKSFFRRVFIHITLASPAAVGHHGQSLQLSQAWVGTGEDHRAAKMWSISQVRLVLFLLLSHFAALAIVTGLTAIFQLEAYKARKSRRDCCPHTRLFRPSWQRWGFIWPGSSHLE